MREQFIRNSIEQQDILNRPNFVRNSVGLNLNTNSTENVMGIQTSKRVLKKMEKVQKSMEFGHKKSPEILVEI